MGHSQRTLVIDTPTPACSVALFDDGALVEHFYETPGRGHAEILPLMLARLPDSGRAGHIRVNCGPGSFTGLRVGLAAARALALVWNAGLSGYTTHNLLAHMALKNRSESSKSGVDVVMNGGHGQIFWQAFDEKARAITEIESLLPQDVSQKCISNCLVGNVTGQIDAIRSVKTVFQQWNMLPDAAQAMMITEGSEILEPYPVYIRAPDAMRADKNHIAPSGEGAPC